MDRCVDWPSPRWDYTVIQNLEETRRTKLANDGEQTAGRERPPRGRDVSERLIHKIDSVMAVAPACGQKRHGFISLPRNYINARVLASSRKGMSWKFERRINFLVVRNIRAAVIPKNFNH